MADAKRNAQQGGQRGRGARGARGAGRGRGGGALHPHRNQHTQSQQQQQPVAAYNGDVVTGAWDDTPLPSGTATPLTGDGKTSHLSDVTFESLRGKVDDRILKNIKFSNMTTVQAATLSQALEGKDVLAQAKTGTGKTIAFLLPAIQRLLSLPRAPTRGNVSVLVLSPTRELALQIEAEANILLNGLSASLGVQHVVGGTNMSSEQRRLKSDRCDILIATPGRLLDHLENSDLAPKFRELHTLVLDEADRMLDMGFRREIEKIKAYLPDRKQRPRQSLLFSATYPESVLQVADVLPDHAFVNTIPEAEQNTHKHVPQDYQISEMQDLLPLTLLHILAERKRSPGRAKIIAFFPTARATSLAAEVFSAIKGADLGRIFELHSRMSQPKRTKTSEDFRSCAEGVLFSSDVAARGVDFPNVSLVIQTGLPSSSDQYVHRLGRTARAGAAGKGLLLLADWEATFLGLAGIKALPLKAFDPPSSFDADLAQARSLVAGALLKHISPESKAQMYQASLGYYNSSMIKFGGKEQMVALMNRYARDALGYVDEQGGTTPPLLAKTVGKMGLKGVPGLNVVRQLPGDNQAEGGGGGQNRGSMGGGSGRGGSGRGGRGGSGRGGGRGGGDGGAGPARRGRGDSRARPF